MNDAMGIVGKIVPENERCDICRKRKAEFLCDMPEGRILTLHIRKLDGSTDYENSYKWITTTCDAKICKECAVEVGNDIHFCMKCFERIKKIQFRPNTGRRK